ncbi:hypothetical protein [Streptomyces sp. NPDC090025]|uniref:hypothetical protein n=1 Tax=Streptomyces sp. NPDC090025 TaxID=3365922 RepID=UPI003833DD8D
MPSLLHYELVVNPTDLQASRPGAPSIGAVYVIASNPGVKSVSVESIALRPAVGDGTNDLTPSPENVAASYVVHKFNQADKPNGAVSFGWNAAKVAFELISLVNSSFTLRPEKSVVLKLENLSVAAAAGLTLLEIEEYDGTNTRRTTLAVAKGTPRAPRDFRAARTLLGEGQQVELHWDGPDNLDYWIQFPDGRTDLVAAADKGPAVTDRSYVWPPPNSGSGSGSGSGADLARFPRRGSTYTLIAGTNVAGQARHGTFLTTTVHALIPEFGSGTRTPWIEAEAAKGRITFTAEGTRTDAGRADGGTRELGTVTALTADVHDVRTESVTGRAADSGSVDFSPAGLNVRKHGGDWGTVSAEKADVTGVNTKWVQGRTSADGWIEFPANGVNVFQGAGDRTWGTLTAGEADLNDLDVRRATIEERLTLKGGLNIENVLEAQVGPPRLIVHAPTQFEKRVNMAVDLHVDGASVFLGKVNANGHLSVRNKNVDWIMHTNDALVSINGDLRVHGTTNTDSSNTEL